MTDRGDLVQRLIHVGSAAMADAGGRVLDRHIQSLWPGATLAGPVLTAHCALGDNLALQAAVANAASGDVLVVGAGGAAAPGAVWGEVLTVAAASRGISGVVIDGLTRDVDAVTRRRFPLWCVGRSPAGPTKVGPGTVGAPLAIGGITVDSGDWLVADGDGVVVISSDLVDAALRKAEDKAGREQQWFAALETGSTTLDLFGLSTESITVY